MEAEFDDGNSFATVTVAAASTRVFFDQLRLESLISGMQGTFEFLLGIFAWAGLVLALLGLASVLEGRRYARRRRDQFPPDISRESKAVILIPCRGLAFNFRQHCQTLLEQDHPNFELLFVVENEQDEAVGTIRNLMQEYRMTRMGLVFSGPAEHCSQKVHQLRTGLKHLPNNAKIIAFVDSDLQVKAHWLRWLCGRLEEPGVAAVTGAVWAVPRKQSLVNNLYCSISNSVASLYGPKFAPGLWGSWAVKVDRLEASRVAQVWNNSFSETWSAQAALCLNGEQIRFEPRSVGVRTVQTDWRAFRQTLVRWFKSHQPCFPTASRLLLFTVMMTQAGFWFAVVKGAMTLTTEPFSSFVHLAVAGAIYGTSVLTGMVRGQLGKLHAADSRFNRMARRWDCWAWPINSALIVIGNLASRVVNRVRWQDLVYRLDSLGRFSLVGRKRVRSAADSLEAEQGERTWGVVRSAEAAPPHGETAPGITVRRKAA